MVSPKMVWEGGGGLGGFGGAGLAGERCTRTPDPVAPPPPPHQGVGGAMGSVGAGLIWIYGGLIKICAPLWYVRILYTYALALQNSIKSLLNQLNESNVQNLKVSYLSRLLQSKSSTSAHFRFVQSAQFRKMIFVKVKKETSFT
jgi:hypothetical protein